MKRSELKQLIKEEIKKSIKEGFRDPEDNYGFGDSNPDYFDVLLYWKEKTPTDKKTLENFVNFLDKHTSKLPDSLLKLIGGRKSVDYDEDFTDEDYDKWDAENL